jgi:hypothetical protein
MWREKLKKAILVAGAIAAVVLVAYVATCRGRPYGMSAAAADSREVQEALEVVRGIAKNPDSAPQAMSAQANRRARDAVAAVARQMNQASSVEFKDAVWFGQYLRLGVTCRAPGRADVNRYFFLKQEDGRLKVTGLAQ